MIIGCFINNFKLYSTSDYVNLTNKSNTKFTSIIGPNGSGKSSILEAIAYLYKQIEWIDNVTSNNDGYISCVFKVEKNNFDDWVFNNHKNTEAKNIIEHIRANSDFLKATVKTEYQGVALTKSISSYINHLILIENDLSNHYLINIGRTNSGGSTTKPFSKINDQNLTPKIYDLITKYYTYIYVSASSVASDILRIHGIQMQKIMNKDVVDQIENLLINKVELNKKDKSILDHINSELDRFVHEINQSLQRIEHNKEYEFKTKRNVKKNVTTLDVTESIINAFFERRLLRIDSKDVKHLSSGEQRKAILNVIYAFLKNKGSETDSTGRNIIFAIDEPEISQDSKSCYDQFFRLYELASEFNTQIIITTHWYGILPIIDHGTLIHINDNNKTIFDFFNILDQKPNFPDDLNMKSLYDLSNSLRNYLRSDNAKNTIICEGGTDKRYLELFLDKEHVHIIPCGGKDNVVTLYELLRLSLESDKSLATAIKRKTLFLTDTDEHITKYSEVKKDNTGKIFIKRLQIDDKVGSVQLVNIYDARTENLHTATRIEDVLDGELYYQSLKLLEAQGKISLSNYEFIPGNKHSRLHPSPSIIFAKNIYAQQNISVFLEEISKLKTEISYIYSDLFKKIEFNNFNLSFIYLANEIGKCFQNPVLDNDVLNRIKSIYISKIFYLLQLVNMEKKSKEISKKDLFSLFSEAIEI